jgi:hypothetical protein
LHRTLNGPQNRFGRGGKKKKKRIPSLLLSGLKPSCPACTVVTVLTELPRLSLFVRILRVWNMYLSLFDTKYYSSSTSQCLLALTLYLPISVWMLLGEGGSCGYRSHSFGFLGSNSFQIYLLFGVNRIKHLIPVI